MSQESWLRNVHTVTVIFPRDASNSPPAEVTNSPGCWSLGNCHVNTMHEKSDSESDILLCWWNQMWGKLEQWCRKEKKKLQEEKQKMFDGVYLQNELTVSCQERVVYLHCSSEQHACTCYTPVTPPLQTTRPLHEPDREFVTALLQLSAVM